MPNYRIGCLFTRVAMAICLVFLAFTTVTPAVSAAPDDQNPGNDGTQTEVNIMPAHIGGIPFETFLGSESYLHVLRSSAMQHEQSFGPCATPVFQGRVGVGRPQVPRPIPEYGMVPQWIEILEIGGCSPSHELNILIAIVNGAPQFYPLLPGNGLSLLDFTVNRDVVKTLVKFERTHAVTLGCSDTDAVRIYDIRLLSYRKDGESIIWEEAWDISNCKARKSLTVHFNANPSTGTNFTIHQPEPVNTVAGRKTGETKLAR